ncbi:MAG: tail fiber domain-containing protein [Bacteroidales bacterium]
MKTKIYNIMRSNLINVFFIIIMGTFSLGLYAQTGNHVGGNGAGSSLTTGDYNTFIGDSAGYEVTTGQYNTFMGYRAGYFWYNDNDNTIIGSNAGGGGSLSTSFGTDNVIIGKEAGFTGPGTDNTFLGAKAGYSTESTGIDNTFIGEEAGINNTTGDDNVFVGEDSGYNNTTASDNTFIGSTAGRSNTTGYRNAFVGSESGYDNTTGIWNTAVGDSSLTDNGAGWGNTAIGQAAGAATEHADFNTFVGARAGWDNNRTNSTTNANRNTYVGFEAGYSNREGEDNVGMGAFADVGNTVRYRNTFIGSSAFINQNDITSIGYDTYSTGQYSCLVGSGADVRSQGAIAIGYLSNISTNSNNSIAIGRETTITNAANSIAIGNGVAIINANEVVIGNAATSVIGGSVNWTATSDGRFKSNVEENVVGLDFINNLRPVTYQMDAEKIYTFYGMEIPEYLKPSLEEKGQIRYSGFIAQEVEQQAIAAGYNFSGVKTPQSDEDAYGLRYAEFVVPLVKSTQELYDIIEAQQQTIAQYENALNDLTARVEKMENQMDLKANKLFANKK